MANAFIEKDGIKQENIANTMLLPLWEELLQASSIRKFLTTKRRSK
jgi:hypothetical protein